MDNQLFSIFLRSCVLSVLLLMHPVLAALYIPPPPSLDDRAYLLMDYQTGQILAAHNADEHLGPASLTKLMTSYLVEQALQDGRLHEDDMVNISEKAWRHGSNEESTMFLPIHGQAKVIDLLRGIIVVSANDACTAVAEHIAGTELAFADIMNVTATSMGLTNTHFVNASGLPDPEHYSTAHDLAVLARHIIKDNPHYYPIYSEHDFSWNGHKQGNRNELLYSDPSVDGFKTGHTEESGYSLVASAHRQGMRLIAVVLGTNSMRARTEQARSLLNWGFSFYQTVTPYNANAVLSHVHIWYAQKDQITAGIAEDMQITIPKGSQNNLNAIMEIYPHLQAPIKNRQMVGKILTTLYGKPYAEYPLVALEADQRAGFFKRLWQHLLMFLEHIF